MFEKIFDAFNAGSGQRQQEQHADDLPRATAALFVEAARADGDYAEGEREAITDLLQSAFDLDRTEAEALRLQGEEAQAEASDIWRFASVVKNATDHSARVAFFERMWRIILADGARDPFEDTLMRRLAGLLYVPDAESGAARQRAQAALRDG